MNYASWWPKLHAQRCLTTGCSRRAPVVEVAHYARHVDEARPLLSPGRLGNFRFPTDDDLNRDTGMAQHGGQGIDTEAVDLASDKVADPRLRHFQPNRKDGNQRLRVT